MRPSPEHELEQALDRELRQLPGPKAPSTLMPRVLRAIEARERMPWWQKSYASWPWAARLAFLVISGSLAALVLYFTWGLSDGITFGALSDEMAAVTQRWTAVRSIAAALGGATMAIARSAGAWTLWGVAAIAGACYLTTLTLGTYCYRLVSQRI
ncbi:MAG: hypothetical protein JNK85_06655 [Verrucomicrobiales bacterium]|nr:hypothetical protein [Verrucomicrobiales bacterium]